MNRESLRDAIEAEYLAASLRAPEMFYRARDRVDADTLRQFARARAEQIRRSLSGSDADVQWGVDQIEARWQRISSLRPSMRIVSLLAAHASALLYPEGSQMVLRVDGGDPAREILRWRFISLAIPPGILITAATPKGVRPAAAVRPLHRAMAPDTPVAHQHVHHAAMLSFEELWASLRLRALTRPGRYWEAFGNNKAFCPGLHRGRCIGGRAPADRGLGEKYHFARRKHLIEWAAMVRLSLFARGLLERHLPHTGPLAKCVECAAGRREIAALTHGRAVQFSETTRSYLWPDEAVALRRRQREHDEHPSPTGFPAQIAAEELRFLIRAFTHVTPRAAVSGDELFEKVLLQYLRVKTAVFGLLVHPPGEPGLDNFLDHFTQIKVYAPEADRAVPRRPDEPGLDVRATEYRVAPDAWFRVRRRKEIETRVKGTTLPGTESGWLIHFKRKAPTRGALPLHGDSIRSMDAEADEIMRYMEAEPRQLTTLRGIDICGVEEAQPCWVVADTLRRLRRKSEDVAARSARRELQPLRLALHAGEDFQWLTTGVRAIAEPFAWNLLRRGDRIGHGIAITLDPKRWWKRKSRDVVHVERFDSFLNLAFLAKYVPSPNRDQREWLRVSISEAVKQLGLDGGTGRPSHSNVEEVVETAQRFWSSLGTPALRRVIATPDIAVAGGQRHLEWLHRYLWNRSVHERGQERIPRRLEDDRGSLPLVSTHTELDLLIEARQQVIRDLARWQICIEANPSSNLVVGGLDSMLAQDFLYRRPSLPATQKGDETLMWTISTDDPITFSTTLSDEYAYAWAGMILRKDKEYDPEYARALIEEVAATSMRTRFTIPTDEPEIRASHRERNRRTGRS